MSRREEALVVRSVGLVPAMLVAAALSGCSGSTPGRPGSGGAPGNAGQGGGSATAGGGGVNGAGGQGGGSKGGPEAGGAAGASTGAGGAVGGAGGSVGGGSAGKAGSGGGGAGGTRPAAGGAAGISMGGGGGGGGSCIAALGGTYTIRANGHAVIEGGATETVVVDDASGVAATPLQNVLAVQQNYYAACALVAGGTVSCWEEDMTNGNAVGQLGNGTKTAIATYRAVPVLVKAGQPLTHVVSLASGVYTPAFCAVTDDKKLWCWGDLTWLVSGGTTNYSPYAQAITQNGQDALTGVIQAALGGSQACAVVEGSPNNTVWCWGASFGEELGQGDKINHQYPVQVPHLSNPSKVVLSRAQNNGDIGGCEGNNTAYSSTCVLDEGAVECWGGGGGCNGVVSIPAPTLVVTSASPVLREVIDIQEGYRQFSFLRSDGTAWLWATPNGQAAAYGVPQILGVGWGGGSGDSAGFRYLTSDGQYHINTTNSKIDCSH